MRLIPLGPMAVAMLANRRGQGLADASTLLFSTRTGSTLDRRTLLSRQLKPAAKAVGLGNVRLGTCSATATPLCMIQSERPSEPYRLCWDTHRVRSRARYTYIRWLPIEGRQRKNWKLILLDPNRTQVLYLGHRCFRDLLVQKKLLVGAIGFEPTTPCAQGRAELAP